jgi:hypothetical protein
MEPQDPVVLAVAVAVAVRVLCHQKHLQLIMAAEEMVVV